MGSMRETETGTLEGFLLARIAEDEQTIRIVSNGKPIVGGILAEASGDVLSVKRMLAECDAKRRIIELIEPGLDHMHYACETAAYEYMCEPCQLRALMALPYAGDPDYRPEWRP